MSNILHNESDERAVLAHVAANLRRLRAARGESQQALAARAGVSRRMLVNVERGDVNVSLGTLDRLAEALGVAFPALVTPPDRAGGSRIEELAWQGTDPRSRAMLLAAQPSMREVELWHMSLAPGARYDSPANAAGWHEMVYVVAGELVVEVGGTGRVVGTGDFEAFASDTPHGYHNPRDDCTTVFLRNVVY